MCLVYHDGINSQLLKGNKVILPAFICKCRHLFLQLLFLALHLLNRPLLPVLALHVINRIGNLINLCLKHTLLSFRRNRYLLKLRMAHNDTVIIPGCYP